MKLKVNYNNRLSNTNSFQTHLNEDSFQNEVTIDTTYIDDNTQSKINLFMIKPDIKSNKE